MPLQPLLRQVGQQFLRESNLSKSFSGRQRQLEGRALQMVQEDDQVVGVDVGTLRTLLEEVARMGDDVLIERARAGDEDGRGHALATSGPAHLLPGAGNGAGESGQHGRAHLTDVHPQFEGVGGNHGAHPTLAQAGFDGPPFFRQIASTIAARGSILVMRIT